LYSKFEVDTLDTPDTINNDPSFAAKQLELYMKNKTGILYQMELIYEDSNHELNKLGVLANAPAAAILYDRLPHDSPFVSGPDDPTPGPNTPHYELVFGVSGSPRSSLTSNIISDEI
jgi:hypothetical protein